jgi:hypothetical protein
MQALRLAVHVAVVAWPINFGWEMAQAYLYAPMGTIGKATWECVAASFGDVFIVLAIAGITSLVFGGTGWLVQRRPAAFATAAFLGAAVAIVIEWRALGAGQWAYSPWMPILPGIGVGFVPVLQMMLLPSAIFLLARTTLWRFTPRTGARAR